MHDMLVGNTEESGDSKAKADNEMQSQIDAWKRSGDVHRFTIDGKIGYFKSPDRKILSFATASGSSDPLKFNDALIKNCWLGGDRSIIDDDRYFLTLNQKIGDLITIYESEMVKL